jgi:Tfp pilus assembly protein PilF
LQVSIPAKRNEAIIMKATVLIVGLLLCLTKGASAQELSVDEAKSMLRGGHAERAVEVLESVIERDANNASAHYWLANAYGQSVESAGVFSRMMSLARKAGTAFERAVELDPSYVEARFGVLEFNLMAPGMLGGSVAKAREQATAIRKLDQIAGHRAFAMVAVAAGDVVAAHKEHAEAVRLHPESTAAHYGYGVFLMVDLKDYPLAREQFSRALALDASHRPAQFQLRHAAALAGNHLDEGTEALKGYIDGRPSENDLPLNRAHYWLGQILEK